MTRVPRRSTSGTARVSRSTIRGTRPNLLGRDEPPSRRSENVRERSPERRPERMISVAMPSWRAVEAGTDLLARAREIERSWDRLLGEGALGPDLPPRATAGMRPTIVESWRRAVATGLEPIDVLPSVDEDPSET